MRYASCNRARSTTVVCSSAAQDSMRAAAAPPPHLVAPQQGGAGVRLPELGESLRGLGRHLHVCLALTGNGEVDGLQRQPHLQLWAARGTRLSVSHRHACMQSVSA